MGGHLIYNAANMFKLELDINQVRIIHEALEIADTWHKQSGRFAPLRAMFDAITKSV